MSDETELVVLVDADDREIGTAPKLDAHRKGLLHRAFSIILHDGRGRLLLQQRHSAKYHSGGLWSNACCGHPRPGERTELAAARRLREELGTECILSPLGICRYRADVSGGLTEHELVHLYSAISSGPFAPDQTEIEATAWWTLDEIGAEAVRAPERFTPWFRIYLSEGWLRDPQADAGWTLV